MVARAKADGLAEDLAEDLMEGLVEDLVPEGREENLEVVRLHLLLGYPVDRNQAAENPVEELH